MASIKQLLFSILFLPFVLSAQVKTPIDEQMLAFLKKMEINALSSNSNSPLGHFDNEVIEPALNSIKPIEFKKQKYKSVIVEIRANYDDSLLLLMAKAKNISMDSVKNGIEKEFNYTHYMSLENKLYNEFVYKVNAKGDTISKNFIDKINHKQVISTPTDTVSLLYDGQDRLIKKSKNVLMQCSKGDSPAKPCYVREDFFYSYSDSTIQGLKYKKDTMDSYFKLLSKKEYKKRLKEYAEGRNPYFYIKEGKKYREMHIWERYDTTIVKLNKNFLFKEKIKYPNKRKEVTKFIYNDKGQVISSDEKTYGYNEVDGAYIDSTKTIFTYDANNLLTERRMQWYSHFGREATEESEFYIYRFSIENDLLYIKKTFQQKNREGILEDESDESVEYWINPNGDIVKTRTSLGKWLRIEQKIKYQLK